MCICAGNRQANPAKPSPAIIETIRKTETVQMNGEVFEIGIDRALIVWEEVRTIGRQV